MKKLVLIANAGVHQAITDHLRSLDVGGFTVSRVEGHDDHTAADPFLSARDRVVGFVPRVRVEMVIPADRLAVILESLRDSTALSGHGVYWVSDVDSFDRF